MKTVLAPNAPWPNKPEEQPKPKLKVVVKKRTPLPRDPSKSANTDKKFTEWAKKNGVPR